MGEITSLIEDVQKDKDQFAKLEQAMEPLINKYMRKLYKDDKDDVYACLLYTSPSPRDRTRSRMPSSA